jgi:hypothetical protein
MEPQSSSLHSQVPTTCPYLEPDTLLAYTQQCKAKIRVWATITKDAKINLKRYGCPTVEEQGLIFFYRNR